MSGLPEHVHTRSGCDSTPAQLQFHSEIGASAGSGKSQAVGRARQWEQTLPNLWGEGGLPWFSMVQTAETPRSCACKGGAPTRCMEYAGSPGCTSSQPGARPPAPRWAPLCPTLCTRRTGIPALPHRRDPQGGGLWLGVPACPWLPPSPWSAAPPWTQLHVLPVPSPRGLGAGPVRLRKGGCGAVSYLWNPGHRGPIAATAAPAAAPAGTACTFLLQLVQWQ